MYSVRAEMCLKAACCAHEELRYHMVRVCARSVCVYPVCISAEDYRSVHHIPFLWLSFCLNNS